MKKRRRDTKQQREAAEKARLRRRLEDLLVGAYGHQSMPDYNKPEEFAGIAAELGLDVLARWVGAIRHALLNDGTEWLANVNQLPNFDMLDKAVDHLWTYGVRAD